jgi:hypothetical protein
MAIHAKVYMMGKVFAPFHEFLYRIFVTGSGCATIAAVIAGDSNRT